jgi:hypothetical protein
LFFFFKLDGSLDESYFAPDCFNLSRKSQAALAAELWNNIVNIQN